MLNKIDALPDRARLDGLLSRYPSAVPVSARKGLGLPPGRGGQRRPEPQFPRPGRGDGRGERPLLAYLAAHGEILSKKYRDERVSVHCRISSQFLGQIEGDGGVVRKRE